MMQNSPSICYSLTLIIKILFSFLMVLVLPFYIFGQECSDNLKKSCLAPEDKEYKKFNISRAALVPVNTPNLCSVVFPPNKEYLIEFYSKSKYKPLKIKLIDKKSNQIIYDNRTDEYKESTSFRIDENPIDIIIEITVDTNKLKMDNPEVESVCAGFTIFFKKRS
jgi:hypothetical protein